MGLFFLIAFGIYVSALLMRIFGVGFAVALIVCIFYAVIAK